MTNHNAEPVTTHEITKTQLQVEAEEYRKQLEAQAHMEQMETEPEPIDVLLATKIGMVGLDGGLGLGVGPEHLISGVIEKAEPIERTIVMPEYVPPKHEARAEIPPVVLERHEDEEESEESLKKDAKEALAASNLSQNVRNLIFKLEQRRREGLEAVASQEVLNDLKGTAENLDNLLIKEDFKIEDLEDSVLQLEASTERLLRETMPAPDNENEQSLHTMESSLGDLEASATDMAEDIKTQDASPDKKISEPLRDSLERVGDNTAKKVSRVNELIKTLSASY